MKKIVLLVSSMVLYIAISARTPERVVPTKVADLLNSIQNVVSPEGRVALNRYIIQYKKGTISEIQLEKIAQAARNLEQLYKTFTMQSKMNDIIKIGVYLQKLYHGSYTLEQLKNIVSNSEKLIQRVSVLPMLGSAQRPIDLEKEMELEIDEQFWIEQRLGLDPLTDIVE
jgi:hypothetical protein